MPSTDEKGAIAETAIVHAGTKCRIHVAKPLSSGLRYDLVFDTGTRLLRVQCKSALLRKDVIVVQCHSTTRSRGGFVKRPYLTGEVDAVAAYVAELDRCYLLPIGLVAGRAYLQLRLQPTRNNQRAGVHWASGFEFESLDWEGVKGP